MSRPAHVPVLLEEAVEALKVQPGGRYVDCTLGAGGHSQTIMECSQPGGQLLGIDADPEAVQIARARLESFGESVLLVNQNFSNLESICYRHDFLPVHGVLFDLGMASFQIDTAERGFSFQLEAPLDMRVNPRQEITAADIVNEYGENELADLIWKYGEESFSRRIARRIVEARPIRTTTHLADEVEKAVGGRRGKIHPATKTFQALRIIVNGELENLEAALSQSIKVLGFEGRLVVISYHSLEDRIVKQFIHHEATGCICPPGTPTCICGHAATLKIIAKRVIVPAEEEMQDNPRSRSARLRVAERILHEDINDNLVETLGYSVEVKANAWRQPTLLKRVRQQFLAA
jgi:16S rRNA (cytosine1402-N4)-methyltransferase